MTSPSTPGPPPPPTPPPPPPATTDPPRPPASTTAPLPEFTGVLPPLLPRPPSPVSGPIPEPTPDPASSSPTSTDGAVRTPAADRAALAAAADWEEGLGHAVHAAGDQLNELLAPATELFLTDPNDEAGIAKPLSRVIARRLPARMLAVGNPDAKDVGAALLVLARYALKQVNLFRAYKREGALVTPVQPPATDA